MKEIALAALPQFYHKWCQRFDDLFKHKSQKREFRNYLAGLLGERERKNLEQMSNNLVGATYHRTHHFLTEAPWHPDLINERRLNIMNKCRKTN